MNKQELVNECMDILAGYIQFPSTVSIRHDSYTGGVCRYHIAGTFIKRCAIGELAHRNGIDTEPFAEAEGCVGDVFDGLVEPIIDPYLDTGEVTHFLDLVQGAHDDLARSCIGSNTIHTNIASPFKQVIQAAIDMGCMPSGPSFAIIKQFINKHS